MTEENTLSIAQFVPAVAELQGMAARARATDVTKFDDVHSMRLMLRDARVDITKRGKEMREGAMRFQKEVIAKEKELVGLIEPEEERLWIVEEELELREEMEKRRGELPSRIAALASVGDELPMDEAEILAMDDSQFNEYRLRRIDAKLTKDRIEHEEKISREDEERRKALFEEDRTRREKLVAEEAELSQKRQELDREKARLAGMEEQRQREEAAKRAETERLEREAKLKADAEKAAADKAAFEKAEMEKEARYQKFLDDNRHDVDTDILKRSIDQKEIILFREVARFKI